MLDTLEEMKEVIPNPKYVQQQLKKPEETNIPGKGGRGGEVVQLRCFVISFCVGVVLFLFVWVFFFADHIIEYMVFKYFVLVPHIFNRQNNSDLKAVWVPPQTFFFNEIET